VIINVRKYLFIGAQEELDEFLKRAQQKGFIEFVSASPKKAAEYPPAVQQLIAAIKTVRKMPQGEPYTQGGDGEDALRAAEQILALKSEIEKLYEEKRLLHAEIVRVAPFGDFSLEDVDFLEKAGRKKMQFFCMRTAKSHQTNFGDEVLYVGTEYDLDYFVTVDAVPGAYPEMIEMRIDRPLGDLKARLAIAEDLIGKYEGELRGYAGYAAFLTEALVEKLNTHHIAAVKREVSFPLDNSLFVMEGWVPESRLGALFGMLQGIAVHSEHIATEARETVPTYMENKGLARLGEDLVGIYDVPATSDKDPSGWVLWAFTLFFAMIIADAGYGLLYLGLAAYLKYKFPRLKGQAKRLFRLFVLLSCACVVWGVLTAAYFGVNMGPDSALGKLSIIHYLAEKKAYYHFERRDDVFEEWVKECPDLAAAPTSHKMLEEAVVYKEGHTSYEMYTQFSRNILLEFSVFLGVVHISLSILRYVRRNLAGLGWIAFMIGGYLYFPSVLNATTFLHFLVGVPQAEGSAMGLQLLYGGIGWAVIAALIQKRWKGLGEIANVVQIFADVLSYLRLYALGLAGSIMAETFNGIGAYVGLVAGFVAIILGHAVNIQLGVMAGVIHGLRLNFLEWYHYSFDGGGRLFKPLKKMKAN
jgi:V/A-type H+-transporting ATPase subunit I